MPPQRIHIRDENGFRRPFVYGFSAERDPVTLAKVFTIDEEQKLPIEFFSGEGFVFPYFAWGTIIPFSWFSRGAFESNPWLNHWGYFRLFW